MNLKLRTKILSLIGIFVMIIVVIGFFAVWTVQDKVISAAMEKLKGDLAMGRLLLEEKVRGEWSIRDGKLCKGDVIMNDNFSIVDTIGGATGDTVTIFQGDTRVATNVKTAEGKRAVGTQAAPNVVETTLKKGELYLGKAQVVGVWNQTAYEPIKNTRGEMLGMFYVGVPNTRYDQVVKEITARLVLFSTVGLLIVLVLGFYIIRTTVKPINAVIEGLTEGVDQVASGSSQVSAASQSLAEGASEQAAGLEETSSSIEEMTSMTKQNAANASEADTLMKDTSRVVEEANHSMTELTESMKEISGASEETAKIIKTIDEIAFQTNLLALNAAVEAARAGEAGAGFAVVADEVRNLAMRAAEAAKNTSNLIEGTVKKIKNGSDIVSKTYEAFSKVETGAKKVGELVGEISAASNEQAQGIEQINKAVAEMDKVVQQNAASAEEAASAAAEMNSQTTTMNDFVGELTALVRGRKNGGGDFQGTDLPSSVSHDSGNGKGSKVGRSGLPSFKSPVPRVRAAFDHNAQGKKMTLAGTKGSQPEQVIPLKEGDFKEF
jgi:methyl-accepting chemotaxis protein